MNGINVTNSGSFSNLWGVFPPPSQDKSFFETVSDVVTKEMQAWEEFSFSTFFHRHCEQIFIGCMAGLGVFLFMGQLDFVFQAIAVGGNSSGAIQAAINLAHLPTTLVSGLLKTFFLAFNCLFIPYFEEFVFRGCLHEWVEGCQGTSIEKAAKIGMNAALFALYHIPEIMLSASGGVIFLQIFLLGAAFASLRTYYDSRIVSTAAHMTYNTLILGMIFTLA